MADMLGDYAWLMKEPGPLMLKEALKLYGVAEIVGEKHNPTILNWAKEIGVDDVYKADETPWCGLFVGVIARRSGKEIPKTPLWAKSWAKWGKSCDPSLGCVLVFEREGGGGHAGLYVGEDYDFYHVLGGNQKNCVCVRRIEKKRCIAARELYIHARPNNVRKIVLSPHGMISSNEA